MTNLPFVIELDVLSAALAKLRVDLPATEVFEAIKEEAEKKSAKRRCVCYKYRDDFEVLVPTPFAQEKPLFGRLASLIPEDTPEAHQQNLRVLAHYNEEAP